MLQTEGASQILSFLLAVYESPDYIYLDKLPDNCAASKLTKGSRGEGEREWTCRRSFRSGVETNIG